MGENVRGSAPAPELDGSGLRIGVIASRFNDHITVRLREGAQRALEDLKVAEVVEAWVPGAFELPLAAKVLAGTGRVDAVVCLGCVIRGETGHYELVAGECARGIQDAQLATGVPIVFGVLTTEDLEQALERSGGPGARNAGEEAVHVAVEMVGVLNRFDPKRVGA
jgi:6,7-dimethyl-8-ribityllumazine synthase